MVGQRKTNRDLHAESIKTSRSATLFPLLGLVILSALSTESVLAQAERNQPWECDRYFSQAQYDSEGLGLGVQRLLVDSDKNVFIVYSSKALAIQPRCIFYESRLGEESAHSVPPHGIYRFRYILRSGYLEKKECIDGTGCQLKRYNQR